MEIRYGVREKGEKGALFGGGDYCFHTLMKKECCRGSYQGNMDSVRESTKKYYVGGSTRPGGEGWGRGGILFYVKENDVARVAL